MTFTVLHFSAFDGSQARGIPPQPERTAFAQKDNGMFIAAAVGNRADFGEDPQQPFVRLFIDHKSAASFLRSKIGEVYPNVSFEEKEGQPMVTTAEQMPSNLRQ